MTDEQQGTDKSVQNDETQLILYPGIEDDHAAPPTIPERPTNASYSVIRDSGFFDGLFQKLSGLFNRRDGDT